MMTTALSTSLLGLSLLGAVSLPGDDDLAGAQRPFYPLTTCIVDGDPLGQGNASEDSAEEATAAIEVVIGQRLYRLCSEECVLKLKALPDRFAARLDEAVVQAQLPLYPLTTCPLSDEPLPAAAQLVVLESRLVKLCCKNCVHSLRMDPEPAFAALDAAAIAAQQADYPLKSCPITGKPLGDEPRDVLYGAQLIRLCCGSCVRKFEADPTPALAAVRAALPERAEPSQPLKHGPILSLKRVSDSDAPTGRGGR